jgi:hypothetical protein
MTVRYVSIRYKLSKVAEVSVKGDPFGVAFNPTGSLLAVGCYDKKK